MNITKLRNIDNFSIMVFSTQLTVFWNRYHYQNEYPWVSSYYEKMSLSCNRIDKRRHWMPLHGFILQWKKALKIPNFTLNFKFFIYTKYLEYLDRAQKPKSGREIPNLLIYIWWEQSSVISFCENKNFHFYFLEKILILQ